MAADISAGAAYGVAHALAGEVTLSSAAMTAAIVSILVSLWVGVSGAMGVRGAKGLPAHCPKPRRYVFGLLTFLLWYTAMLAAASVVAMFTVRTLRDVGPTAAALFAATVLWWGLRRMVRPSAAPTHV